MRYAELLAYVPSLVMMSVLSFAASVYYGGSGHQSVWVPRALTDDVFWREYVRAEAAPHTFLTAQECSDWAETSLHGLFDMGRESRRKP